MAQQLTTDSLDTGLGGKGGEGKGRHRGPKGTAWGRVSTQGIRTPPLLASRIPHQSPSRKRRLSPGARQHPPWCSRPAKVPVVRVLCRYKLGVRLGRVLLHISLAHSSGRGLSPASLQLTPANVGWGGGSPWARVPTCHPRGDRELVGRSAVHWGSLQDTATYPAAERDPAPSAAQQRPPPRALAGTPGPCAPRATRPAWHKGSMAQPRPAASASRRRPQDSSPGRCCRQPCPPPAPFPGQAGHRAEPCAPARSKQRGGGLRSLPLSLHRDVSSLGGYL